MEDTSGNPPEEERGGLGPSREDTEQGVDDIFLAHQDGDENVGDNSVGNLSGVRLVGRREADKHGHVGCEGDTEQPSVSGEEHVAEIPDRLGVLLLDIFFIEITLPPEGLLLVGDILSRVARRSRLCNSFLGFLSGWEVDDFGSLNSWFWGGNDFTTAR